MDASQLHCRHMSMTFSLCLPDELAQWVTENVRVTGSRQGGLVIEALERMRQAAVTRPFLSLAGSVEKPSNLSQRKGFLRS